MGPKLWSTNPIKNPSKMHPEKMGPKSHHPDSRGMKVHRPLGIFGWTVLPTPWHLKERPISRRWWWWSSWLAKKTYPNKTGGEHVTKWCDSLNTQNITKHKTPRNHLEKYHPKCYAGCELLLLWRELDLSRYIFYTNVFSLPTGNHPIHHPWHHENH